ncbi:hypothetical protein [Saccharothrix sp. Mg75]|uniref:hypothetical protein n=1 Tax=Saccharothrix sp. Mg75 TaxID=3445357 RepID=UPI003EEBD5CC
MSVPVSRTPSGDLSRAFADADSSPGTRDARSESEIDVMSGLGGYGHHLPDAYQAEQFHCRVLLREGVRGVVPAPWAGREVAVVIEFEDVVWQESFSGAQSGG